MNTEATALIPYDVQGPTTEVLSIMKRVASLTTEKKYKSENVNLLLWIYDDNNSFNDDICKDALDAVNKASNNCPIILPSLTFNIFSHYLTTRRKDDRTIV